MKTEHFKCRGHGMIPSIYRRKETGISRSKAALGLSPSRNTLEIREFHRSRFANQDFGTVFLQLNEKLLGQLPVLEHGGV